MKDQLLLLRNQLKTGHRISFAEAMLLQRAIDILVNKAGNSPAQNYASPEQSPIDHGYRPECECSGCKATSRICAELAGNSQVIGIDQASGPDRTVEVRYVAPPGYVMVPMRLTAENGAKGALCGEFSETKFVNCPECFGDDECETCDGSGRIEITVPVTWTTIKEIWAKGVEHFAAAPQSPGSEPATVPGKWIPVSERMPDREVDVQVYCPDKKEQMVAYLERNELEGYFRFATWRTGDGIYCQPTHWMPLPAAPQEAINALIPLASRNEQEGK